MVGKKLGFRAFVAQLRGDWAEFSHTLGFPTWSSKLNPCIFCRCTKANMLTLLRSCSARSLPWDLKTDESYSADCTNCEILKPCTSFQTVTAS